MPQRIYDQYAPGDRNLDGRGLADVDTDLFANGDADTSTNGHPHHRLCSNQRGLSNRRLQCSQRDVNCKTDPGQRHRHLDGHANGDRHTQRNR